MQAIEKMYETARDGDVPRDAREALKEWAGELIENHNGHILRAGMEAVIACAEFLNAYDVKVKEDPR